MAEPFNLVSVADFERMSRAEKDEYLDAFIAHLQAIKQVPADEARKPRNADAGGPPDGG